MLKEHALLPLFQKFIASCHNGKRLNKNGNRIKLQSIVNYEYCYKLLESFSSDKKTYLILYEISGNNKREHNRLKRYWKDFYKTFTKYLYQERGCYDNYVGQTIKLIRTFFNWCNMDAGIFIGLYYKQFYVQKEEIDIITLSTHQLRFLLFDRNFEDMLSIPLQRSKDIFVIGCLVGLRYSDLSRIKSENIEQREGNCYLKMRSKKTNTDTIVKLPVPVLKILAKYTQSKKVLLPTVSLFRFNTNIKKIAEMAGWTHLIPSYRSKKGMQNYKNGKNVVEKRFCDSLSSHTMRRTSITTMLTSGMPEYIVRKISGHTSDSKAFYRYVHLAQSLMDKEIDKMHQIFQQETYENNINK
ncbi:MAG: tyrosine-type recombinase/integrase [Actinomycetes bacterium]